MPRINCSAARIEEMTRMWWRPKSVSPRRALYKHFPSKGEAGGANDDATV